MKKLILVIAVAAFATLSAQAQDSKSTSLSVAVNVGIPTSSPSAYSIAFGADLQADFAVAPTTKITASAGYENFTTKKEFTDAGADKSYGMIPVLAGAKFFFGEGGKMYGHAQLGYGFATAKGADGAFAYAPSLGYYFSPNFDGSIKYLAFSRSGSTLGLIGIRLAYNF
jgi:hypothetical protein